MLLVGGQIKMVFIEPLNLEVWIVNLLSGSPQIFTGIAIFFIVGMAAYFRMNGLALFFLFALFFSMFSRWVDPSIYFILISVGGLLIGYWIRKMVSTS